MPTTKAKPAKKKSSKPVVVHPDVQQDFTKAPMGETAHVNLQPQTANQDDEIVPESEANQMVDEKIAEEKKALKKLEDELDGQHWSQADPIIPEALKGEVWIAVYKCPKLHKTKATNRQAKSGIACWKCREEGKTVKADIMVQFLQPPEAGDPDVDKRRKARKGSE